MRIIVMFDLPTNTESERKAYTKFRKFLVEDGFIMEQYSVYSRVSLSRDNMETHINRIRANLPETGSVTVFAMTEKQYEQRIIMLQPPRPKVAQETAGIQLTLFF